jgi:hypothetical protein
MILGTIQRIGGLGIALWTSVLTRGHRTYVLSTKHCHACSAAPRVVTTGYQRDSSSKRPESSVACGARPPTATPRHKPRQHLELDTGHSISAQKLNVSASARSATAGPRRSSRESIERRPAEEDLAAEREPCDSKNSGGVWAPERREMTSTRGLTRARRQFPVAN